MKDPVVQESPLSLSLSALNLPPKAVWIITEAKKSGILATGELLRITPPRVRKDAEKLDKIVEWVANLCEALGIVILPTKSKSRIEKAVSSGERLASYESPIRKAKVRLIRVTDEEETDEVISLGEMEETSYLESLTEDVHEEVVSEEDTLGFYLKIVGFYKILPLHEVLALARLVKEKDDLEARNKIVLHNLRLAVHVARRYRGRGIDYLDLIQEGVIGLMTAADRFDYKQGFHFSTYALWYVRQGIVRSLYDQGDLVRRPVHIHELWNAINRVSVKLVDTFGREPSPEEIAKELSQPVENIKLALRTMKMSTVYLDDLIQNNNHDEDEKMPQESEIEGQNVALSPEQLLGAEDELRQTCFRMQQILSCVYSFSGRAYNMFCLRFGLDGTFEPKTLEEIGEVHFLTRERVRQIIEKTCLKLKERGFDIDETWMHGEMYRIEKLGDLLGKEIPAEIFSKKSLPHPSPLIKRRIKPPSISGFKDQLKTSDINPGQVVNAVCGAFKLSHHVLLGRLRTGKVALARQVAMFLLRSDLRRSFPQISKDLHRDHTTVIHGYRHIQKRIKRDGWLSEQIRLVRKRYCK